MQISALKFIHVFFPLLILSCTTAPNTAFRSNDVVVELPAVANMTSDSFSAADAYFKNRQIIQLGEGIHMTREFPQARIQLAKYLFEKHGFDMILFEGSAVESWLASDRILRAANNSPAELAFARDLAFPSIWRAPEYNEVFSRPFYVASYDFQPGMGSLRGAALHEFLEAVSKYAPIPAKKMQKWKTELSRLADRKSGFPNNPLADRAALLKVIAEFETWLPNAARVVEKKYPAVPHARMLSILPAVLRAQIQLWEAHRGDPMLANFKTFQETRDRLGAETIQNIAKQVSRSGKVIVWAHHVHVFHNTQKLARHSLGADLKNKLGDQVYTVGLFAEAGHVYSLAGMEDVIEGPLAAAQNYGIESELSKLAAGKNYFVDFKSLQNAGAAWLTQPTVTRREAGGKLPTIPSQDFDGAIFLRQVSKPKMPWSK